MKTTAILSLGLAAFMGLGAVLPAAAATSAYSTAPATQAAAPAKAVVKHTHYFVALKAKGPGCEIVEVKPATKLMVGKHYFKTEAGAEKALKDAKACRV